MIGAAWDDFRAWLGRNLKRTGFRLVAWGNTLLLEAGRARRPRW